MRDLTNINTVRNILLRHGFKFTKSLGQNFLIDSEIPKLITAQSGIDKTNGVIEIGPGIGTLTLHLSQAASKVVAIELDRSLSPILSENLEDQDNVKVIFNDVLKTDLNKLIEQEFCGLNVAVCANLPYYITTPIIMYLLEGGFPIDSITVMIQKEVAQRFAAKPSTAEYGAITLAVNYYTEPEILFYVPPESFIPQPKVDSAFIKLQVRKKPPVMPYSTKFMFDLIKAAFSQRRKTLVNAIHNCMHDPLTKSVIEDALRQCDIPLNTRGERLSLEDFSNLSNILYKNYKT